MMVAMLYFLYQSLFVILPDEVNHSNLFVLPMTVPITHALMPKPNHEAPLYLTSE